MGADFSFYVKSIATYAPTFLMYNNSVLARVMGVAPDGSFPGWRSLWTRTRVASDAGQDIPEIDQRFSEYKYDVTEGYNALEVAKM